MSSGDRTANGTSGISITAITMPSTPQASRHPSSLIRNAVTGAMTIAEMPPPFAVNPTAVPRRATNHFEISVDCTSRTPVPPMPPTTP